MFYITRSFQLSALSSQLSTLTPPESAFNTVINGHDEQSMMANTLFKIGQIFKGNLGAYTIIKQLQDSVWLARNHEMESFILKSVRHWRLQNERDVLLRFQSKTPYIRPLFDEIESPPALILKFLDDDILRASNKKILTRFELKYVARGVLEALNVLHREGFVHTDIKPSNILVNYGDDKDMRYKDIQVADFGSTISQESSHARDGDAIGTPMFRSPEAHIQMAWGTATDIWSFGATLISLIYGQGFHIFRPDVRVEHEEYDLKILMKHHQVFGPFPASYEEIADQERLAVLSYVMDSCPEETLKPFRYTTEREICSDDKNFICKIMKLDPRDRPSAAQLLQDEWFTKR